jgi:hypothetical protein
MNVAMTHAHGFTILHILHYIFFGLVFIFLLSSYLFVLILFYHFKIYLHVYTLFGPPPPLHSSPSSILEWSFENLERAGHQWLMPVILATQEAEIRRFAFQSMPRLKGVKWKLYQLLLLLVIHG